MSLQPAKGEVISSYPYSSTRANGFSIFVPSGESGNIVATPLENTSSITFSSYTAGEFLRSGVRFKSITSSAASNLEAWYS